MITITTNKLASGVLKNMMANNPKAIASALNKTVAKTKTLASSEVRSIYNISKTDFDKFMTVIRATPQTQAAVLRTHDELISLYKFGAKWKAGQAVGATVTIKRGVPKTIEHSFIGATKNKKTGDTSGNAVYMRKSNSVAKKSRATGKWSELPVRKLSGPSATRFIKNKSIQESLAKQIETEFPTIFAREWNYYTNIAKR